jgi:hypothetical protein
VIQAAHLLLTKIGKPGMTRDDLFKINAGIVRDLITGCAKHCPKAFLLIISNPVNSTVPIAAEVLKAAGVFDPTRLFGVTTLDVVRSETFVAEIVGAGDPGKLTIPVIGGHSGETIVPLFSLAKPHVNIAGEALDKLTYRASARFAKAVADLRRRAVRRRRGRQGQGRRGLCDPLHGLRRLPVRALPVSCPCSRFAASPRRSSGPPEARRASSSRRTSTSPASPAGPRSGS